ncbi:MAG: hypothetical protein J6125_02570, partial [Clostridia bacterium]|nr:hypothetical protein [Clostridia bacterium]
MEQSQRGGAGQAPPGEARMKQACRIGMSRRVFFFRGVAVAECRTPRLSTDDPASWGEVCERANRTAQTFFDEAETVLLPLAAEAYDADPDPRKRFGGVRARLSVSCRAYTAEGLLSLGWRAELYRRDAPASSVAWAKRICRAVFRCLCGCIWASGHFAL